MARSDQIYWSVSDFARALRKDKRTVSAELERSRLPEKARGRARTFPAIDGCRYLVDVAPEPGADLSPADRRNVAQAEKLEAETAILRRDWMPVADACELVGRIADIVQQDVEKWDRDPEERRQIVERTNELIRAFVADHVRGGD